MYVLFQCDSVRLMLEGLGGQRGAQLQGLEQDVGRLKEWAAGLTEKRAQLQSSLSALTDAVGQIEERTAAITKDLANKVQIVTLKSAFAVLKTRKVERSVASPCFSLSIHVSFIHPLGGVSADRCAQDGWPAI